MKWISVESTDTYPVDALILFKKVHFIGGLAMTFAPTSKTFNVLDGLKSITKEKILEESKTIYLNSLKKQSDAFS